MPCFSCRDKLAYRLMRHHKIDMIYAFELADEGMDRVENRDSPPEELQKPKIISGTGNPSDYSQLCNNCGKSCGCDMVETCINATQCQNVGDCVGYSCCPSALPNSHLVSDNCNPVWASFNCSCKVICRGICACTPSGSCDYDCDPPRIWNPVTLACELPAVAKKPIMDGLIFVE